MLVCTDEFQPEAMTAAINGGMPSLRHAVIKHPLGGIAVAAVVRRAGALYEAVADAILKGGPTKAKKAAKTGPTRPASNGLVEIERGLPGVYDLFVDRGWTDGLPIVPPTEEAVAMMLLGTSRHPNETVAQVAPSRGEATVEGIAINAVMAGCRPEYLSIVITAVEAVCQKEFNLEAIQATTHPVSPLIILNGPVVKDLGINSGYNCFGQGSRANATIGRALRLVLVNIGGASPGQGDRATHGGPGKYSYCVGENEDANPWQPLHVDFGHAADQSSVTVIACEGPHNIQDHHSTTADGILRNIAGAMGQAGSNNLLGLGWPLLTLGPEHAAVLAAEGYSKEKIRQYLFENARFPLAELGEEYAKVLIANRGIRKPKGARAPIVARPEDLLVIVAGGAGKHSCWHPTFGGFSRPVSRAIPDALVCIDGSCD